MHIFAWKTKRILSEEIAKLGRYRSSFDCLVVKAESLPIPS
jgi:hypothetical protein